MHGLDLDAPPKDHAILHSSSTSQDASPLTSSQKSLSVLLDQVFYVAQFSFSASSNSSSNPHSTLASKNTHISTTPILMCREELTINRFEYNDRFPGAIFTTISYVRAINKQNSRTSEPDLHNRRAGWCGAAEHRQQHEPFYTLCIHLQSIGF